MVEKTERTVTELSSLFRILQVMPDADSVVKIQLMLLAFCTTWRTIGLQRAYLLLVDPKQRVIRGHLAAERLPLPEESESSGRSTFETLAKRVFESMEQIESSDLTLKTRTFNLPVDWHRSAIVKAVAAEYPVLAEGKMSEFATDPFLAFFGTGTYLAVPIKTHGRVTAVLAADNGITDQRITLEDVSLVSSLAQQATTAIERLLDSTDNNRKFRVLRKLQEVFDHVDTPEKLTEGLSLALSMICRAVGGNGILLKELVRRHTLHIKTVDEFTVEAGDPDLSIGECFESILDRAAGTMRAVRGDSQHALLNEVTAETIRFFFACPLQSSGEGLGALAVYVTQDDTNRDQDRFATKDRTFIEVCAGMIADELRSLQSGSRIAMCEEVLEELRSNLAREKEEARLGSRALDHYQELSASVSRLKEVLNAKGTYQKRLDRAREFVDEIERELSLRRSELSCMKLSLRMTDLFRVVAEVARPWKEHVEPDGIEVTVRIPEHGPSLLMNEDKIRLAFTNILRTLTSCVKEGDKVMIECSSDEERAMVVVADTGEGLPGNLLSRLFMPFSEIDRGDESKNAMTLAGDILYRHAGEITIKSSTSWKTILVVRFPIAANRDRRRTAPPDRRKRSNDRRRKPKVASNV
jgi:signal transduction histidine kinase